MNDYISRQALLRDIEKYHLSDGKFQHWVEVQPSAEAEPVRHGKWERHYIRPGVFANLYWHCSCCGGKLADEFANHYKYCPDCGARMDGKQDG